MAVRGKTAGVFTAKGTFQWTSAVRAFSSLAIQTVLHQSQLTSVEIPSLEGERGSLASSLDYAISKQVLWLADIFGTNSQGNLLANRAFLRSNPNRKRPGPVVIGFNSKFIPYNSIHIAVDCHEAPTADQLKSLLFDISQGEKSLQRKESSSLGEMFGHGWQTKAALSTQPKIL